MFRKSQTQESVAASEGVQDAQQDSKQIPRSIPTILISSKKLRDGNGNVMKQTGPKILISSISLFLSGQQLSKESEKKSRESSSSEENAAPKITATMTHSAS